MRTLIILIVAALTPVLVNAGEAISVDGVRVYGRIHDVTRADIHAVIADCDEKPAMLEIISKTEMHGYRADRKLGWTPCRACYPGGPAAVAAARSGRPCWGGCVGMDILMMPEAFRIIRAANEVYILRVACTEKRHRLELGGSSTIVTPHGDYKHVRLLSADAARKLRRVLGNENNWFHGADHTFGIGPEAKNVGYIFRRGRDEVVLLGFMRWKFDGTCNGQNTGGSLEEKASDRLDAWKKQFAEPELKIK